MASPLPFSLLREWIRGCEGLLYSWLAFSRETNSTKTYWLEGTSLVTPTEEIWQFCSLGSLYLDVTAQLVQKVKADAESHLLWSYPPSTLFSFLLYTPYNVEVKSSLQSDPGFSSPPTSAAHHVLQLYKPTSIPKHNIQRAHGFLTRYFFWASPQPMLL